VNRITADGAGCVQHGGMPLVTRTELLEIVPELRAMANTAKVAALRDTLHLLADRYAAMAVVRGNKAKGEQVTGKIARD
jgi:hypothetical protein